MRATQRVVAAVLIVLIASTAATAPESSNVTAFSGGLDAELEYLMPSEISHRILKGPIHYTKRTLQPGDTGDAGCARGTGNTCGPDRNGRTLNNRCGQYERTCH